MWKFYRWGLGGLGGQLEVGRLGTGHWYNFCFLVHRNPFPWKGLPSSPRPKRCQPEAPSSVLEKKLEINPRVRYVPLPGWLGADGLELAPAIPGPGAPG